MTFSKGQYMIITDRVPLTGKRPALYVGVGNKYVLQVVKAAVFSNDENAQMFEEFMSYLCGGEEPKTNIKHEEAK